MTAPAPRRLRISFVLPAATLSGGNRVVAIHADRLARRGHEVLLVSQPFPGASRLRRLLRRFGLGRRPLKIAPRHSHFDGIAATHWVLETGRPVTDADLPDADVVIATWWRTAYWVLALSPAKGRKAYFIQHHEVYQPRSTAYSTASYHLPLHKITIARWLVDKMVRDYKDPHVDLVPNSVDTVQFNAPPRGRQATPTVGLLYSPSSFKGVDIALKALALLRRRLPELRVVAFGTDPIRSALPLPEGSVYFQDPDQDALAGIYAMCDVWLCASRLEGFGLTILEAMACRCPAVSTRAGGPEDIIEEGVTGHLVEVGDAAALAARLEAVLSMPEADWRAMSDAAHARAHGYSWDDAADRLEAALLRLAGEAASEEG